jgi:fatty-acyl-CoA synthase
VLPLTGELSPDASGFLREMEPPIDTLTIAALIARAATKDGDAVVAGGERVSYAELATRIYGMRGRLRAGGIQPGDRVGIMHEDCVDAIVLMFGAMCLGAIPVPVSTRYKVRELEYLAGHAGLEVLIVGPSYRSIADATELPDGCTLVPGVGASAFEALDSVGSEPASDYLNPTPDSDGVILCTSGTTANPKGCVYKQAGMVFQGLAYARALTLTEEDRFFTPLPFYHVSAIVALLGTIAARCTLVHVGERFDPGPALGLLTKERCTVAFPCFETIWLQVLDLPEFPSADLSALRVVVNVGTPGSLLKMQQAIPEVPQISSFGGTEYGGFTSLGKTSETLEQRTQRSGLPLEGVELRAIDLETGVDVTPDTPGEALMRGIQRFDRYWKDPEQTARAIDADGWYHSGDLISFDNDGRVFFAGRVKDMLKVGGENVGAAEIESYLLSHPAVQIAQVVGAPDRRYVEVPAAFVQLAPGASVSELELIEYCVGQISTFKVPRYVRFVEKWPMSGTKIQKFKLRDSIARELAEAGIEEAPKIVNLATPAASA